MCKLKEPIKDKEMTVYKAIAINKRSGNYFSIAMGFMYRINQFIPKVQKQKSLCKNFIFSILDPKIGAFESNMVGRTVGFIYRVDALQMIIDHPLRVYKNFRLEVKKALVSIDLMKGTYGPFLHEVIGGRKIKFLD